jgi:hypothetical protein
VILLCGIPSEAPLARVATELDALGIEFEFFNQRDVAGSSLSVEVDDTGLHGELRIGGRSCRLDEISGLYVRLMDNRILPELKGVAADSEVRRHSDELHRLFWEWLDITRATVVNRPTAMASNTSKPFQAQLIRAAGIGIPDTLITNQPEQVRAFVAEHGSVIYKSISGCRSVVQELDLSDLDRLDDITWCPVQFQALIDGVDVRVHVIGDDVYATRISSEATDYRYAAMGGGRPAWMTPAVLSDDLTQRCVELTRSLGLVFSGIDLRITNDDRVVCFEVNPCPAFNYFEGNTGQPIARSVARLLAGAVLS